MFLSKIVDKRAHKTLGYFIPQIYEAYVNEIIEKIEREQKLVKLQKIKNTTDWEFLESGVDDGL